MTEDVGHYDKRVHKCKHSNWVFRWISLLTCLNSWCFQVRWIHIQTIRLQHSHLGSGLWWLSGIFISILCSHWYAMHLPKPQWPEAVAPGLHLKFKSIQDNASHKSRVWLDSTCMLSSLNHGGKVKDSSRGDKPLMGFISLFKFCSTGYVVTVFPFPSWLHHHHDSYLCTALTLRHFPF